MAKSYRGRLNVVVTGIKPICHPSSFYPKHIYAIMSYIYEQY